MNKTAFFRNAILSVFAAACLAAPLNSTALESEARPRTYCNPIDLPYRFALESHRHAHGKTGREAADPCVVLHDGVHWLFASKCGGWFRSENLIDWEFIPALEGYPTEDYAPGAACYRGKWLAAFSYGEPPMLCTTDDPASGRWTRLRDFMFIGDPELFVDDDGRIYLFWGCSPDNPLYGVELDPDNDFEPIGKPTVVVEKLDPWEHAWESRAPFAEKKDEEFRKTPASWMEGATVVKHDGRYYLQYSAPGTEFKEYADGVCVADKPLGPYRYQQYSPCVEKTTGFIGGAGHGCTFRDAKGKFWRVSTMTISVNFDFERRLGLFPAGFLPSADGEPDQLVCNTYLGDYPQLAPGEAEDPLQNNLAGWMLLSLNAKCKASSSLDEARGPENAFDEDVRTAWAAATGNKGEFLEADLGKLCRIDAIQVNFAEVDSKAHGRLDDACRFRIEASENGSNWFSLVDMRDNEKDAPHQYFQLDRPVRARFVKIVCESVPGGAKFSLSGLRIFGNGLGAVPERVESVSAKRLESRRAMKVEWTPVSNADFYVVRFGIAPDRLTRNVQVYGKSSVLIPGLNREPEYYAAVDAVNDSGITKGIDSVHAQ